MPNLQPLSLKSDALQKRQFHVLSLMWIITGAKVARLVVKQKGSPVLFGYDAAALTTALIDALLQSEPAVTVASGDIPGDTMFDATALGADSFGLVINMQGQTKAPVALKYEIVTTAGGTPGVVVGMIEGAAAQLTVSSNTNGYAASPLGNLYARIVGATNLDAGTAGYIKLDLIFDAK